jgi:VanZ family protein
MAFGLRSRPLPQLFPHFDLLLHFAAFFILSFLALATLRIRTCAKVLLIIAALIACAALLEWCQALWLPRRTPSILDFAAGVLGAISAWFFLALWSRLTR